MRENNCTSNVSVSIITVLHGIAPLIQKSNGLLLLNAILVAVVVGIGTYAPRYRHHPLIGILFLAATTLFLPIISNVAASVTGTELLMRTIFNSHYSNLEMYCTQYGHIFLIFVWAGLVVIVGVNASVVAAGDTREGINISPPKALTGAAVWTTYLTISTLVNLHRENAPTIFVEQHTVAKIIVFGQLFLILYTKLLFKYYAFYKAQRSFAHGRSPSLVDGYMDQLQQLGDSSDTPTILKEGEYHEHDARLHPPALVVMGEDNVQVDSQPRGYRFKWIPGDGDKVVTLDRVWKLHDMEMLRSSSAAHPKYLGFSFTLFKILRCRFAKYTISSASFTNAQKFFRYTLIKGSGAGYERAFGVVVDELSFLHDYYNSSQPIYYSHHGFVIFSIIFSLYSIGYCIYLMVTYIVLGVTGHHHSQIYCSDECFDEILRFDFAGRYSDVLPLYLVAVVLVLAEARDILFYICSNWTKVSLIYHYVNQASWQQSPIMKKCISVVFKYCSSNRANNWDDRIKQCSILDHPPRLIAHLPARLQRLHNHNKVKLPNAVKAAIFEALKRKCLTSIEPEGSVMYLQRPPCPVPCDTHAELIDGAKCTAYTILAWHIATTVFEVQQQQQLLPLVPEWQHKVAATHLSRYCAYLVACCPELLPDENDEWCKSLYENAKKDAAHVLSMPQGAMRTYPLLDESWMSAQSTQSVLKDGASLGKQLLDSGIGWEPLARFWSEMILYVAPSENLQAQAEAVARGGELVTLLWAMLSHAGIDRRHW